MDEEVLYPVCPHRNVPAAFQRFYGPDSGGIARFFGNERAGFLDRFAALAAAYQRVELRAGMSGARLARAWRHRVPHPQLPLLLDLRPIAAVQVYFIARQAMSRAGRIVTALRQFHGARIARALTDWAAHPQLPLLVAPRPVALLPV